MRPLLLAAFLSSTALVASASAQTPPTPTPTVVPRGEVMGRATIIECDKLAALLEQGRPANPGVTAEQVGAWRAANDATACHQNLERITQAAAAGSTGAGIRPVTTEAAPAPGQPQPATAATPAAPSGAAASAPQVVVQQAQPSVTIRQQQPEVIVRIPPPIITVQQPQPEIVVRMPEPDVSVSVARPEVQVTMPQPQIQVVPPQQALAQPNVQVDGRQPNVRVERTGEPRVVYQQAEGQPQVRFEPIGKATAEAPAQGLGAVGASAAASQPAGALIPSAAQAQLNAGPASAARPGEPQQTGAVPPPSQPIDVATIEDMALYNARGDKMGDVEEVVTGPGNAMFVVIAHGGFLGLGEKQVAMPIDQLAMRGDRLVAESLTDDQIKAMPSFDDGDRNYKQADDKLTASIRVLR